MSAPVGAIAYTADRGWHFVTVDLAEIRSCDREADSTRELLPHGTLAAARRHTRYGTPKCAACKATEAAYLREYRRRKAVA